MCEASMTAHPRAVAASDSLVSSAWTLFINRLHHILLLASGCVFNVTHLTQ